MVRADADPAQLRRFRSLLGDFLGAMAGSLEDGDPTVGSLRGAQALLSLPGAVSDRTLAGAAWLGLSPTARRSRRGTRTS